MGYRFNPLTGEFVPVDNISSSQINVKKVTWEYEDPSTPTGTPITIGTFPANTIVTNLWILSIAETDIDPTTGTFVLKCNGTNLIPTANIEDVIGGNWSWTVSADGIYLNDGGDITIQFDGDAPTQGKIHFLLQYILNT